MPTTAQTRHDGRAAAPLPISEQCIEECLLARVTGNAIGALGYGVFAWKQAQVQVVDSDFQELKARRPPPSPASLARIARPRPGWPRRAGR